jgi:predicted lipoprotein with Yx(FWY)xxD motif
MERRASLRKVGLTWGILGPALLGLSVALAPASTAGAAGTASHSFDITTEHIPSIGTVLATASGRTLYHLTADPTGKATCQGGCAKEWPPLLLPKGDHAKGPHGLKGLGVIRESHGRQQVSFHGEALYRFAGDTKKGQAKGQGVEGTWFAVLESGASASPATAVTLSPATPSTTTPSTTKPATATTQPSATTQTTKAPTTTQPPVTKTTTAPTTPTPPPTTTPPTTPPPTTTPTTAPPGGYGY